MTMPYSGLLQTKTGAHYGGFYYGPGQVFEVENLELWSDDPYHPVILAGVTEEPIAGPPPSVKHVAQYARVHVKVRAASERLNDGTGLREDAPEPRRSDFYA
jgi:hypothetical protein